MLIYSRNNLYYNSDFHRIKLQGKSKYPNENTVPNILHKLTPKRR